MIQGGPNLIQVVSNLIQLVPQYNFSQYLTYPKKPYLSNFNRVGPDMIPTGSLTQTCYRDSSRAQLDSSKAQLNSNRAQIYNKAQSNLLTRSNNSYFSNLNRVGPNLNQVGPNLNQVGPKLNPIKSNLLTHRKYSYFLP